METNAFVARRGETRHARTLRAPKIRRPVEPSALVTFGQRTERRELSKRATASGHERIEPRITVERGPQRLERRQLDRVHAVAVDRALDVQLSTDLLGRGRRFVAGIETGHVLDAQVQRVAEPTAAGEVRARLLGRPRGGRV